MLQRLRPFWMFAIGIPALLLGGFYLWYGWHGYLAAPTLFFPAYWLFWLTVGYAFIAILLAAVGLVIAWVVQAARGRAPSVWSWLAVLITFAGVPLALAGVLPLVASADAPVDSARLGGHVYQLTAHYGAVGFGQFELYECDVLSLFCQPHHIPIIAAGPGDHGELVANEAARTLAIQVNGRTLASFRV